MPFHPEKLQPRTGVRNGWGFILLSAVTLSMGCTSEGFPTLPTVSGEVLIDGKPMEKGFVTFTSQEPGGPFFSANVQDGRFITQIPEETMRVEITAFRAIPGRYYEEIPGRKIPEEEQYLPERYNRKSKLTVDAKQTKEFNFEIESK